MSAYHDIGGIYSTMPTYGVHLTNAYPYYQGYDQMQGTSMAAPQVAGLAALIFAMDKGLSNAEIRDIIESTADDLGRPGKDRSYGFGRINIYNAVVAANGGVNPPPPPLDITSTSLPNGEEGVAYSATVSATGGVPPYSWAITAGTLPVGLSLDPNTGVIDGTPTADGLSNFTIEVQDAQASPETDTQALSISIAPPVDVCTSSIAMTGKKAGPNKSATALVTISEAIDGVTVEGTWAINGTAVKTVSGITDTTGSVTFQSQKIRDINPVTFTFTVTTPLDCSGGTLSNQTTL